MGTSGGTNTILIPPFHDLIMICYEMLFFFSPPPLPDISPIAGFLEEGESVPYKTHAHRELHLVLRDVFIERVSVICLP